jgi:hypothetical protein
MNADIVESSEECHCPDLHALSQKMENQRRSCEEAAQDYLPDGEIKHLLIGESPPISGSYFYKPEGLGRKAQSLPAKVFRAFFGRENGLSRSACEDYLLRLKGEKFFLIDWCPYPIDMFTGPHRVPFLRREISQFLKRYSSLSLSPDVTVFLVLPSATVKELRRRANRDLIEQLGRYGLTESHFVAWGQVEKALGAF